MKHRVMFLNGDIDHIENPNTGDSLCGLVRGQDGRLKTGCREHSLREFEKAHPPTCKTCLKIAKPPTHPIGKE